ncbi:MAG: XRE family transcriptional regulator [Neisseriaceae bacterium]|nr:MAG: XRE family transcriptional regulator [Neisseriaceae bacterium]
MKKTEILIYIGTKIKEHRLQQNLSQEKLAELTDLHRTYIGMIERAEKNITISTLEKITKVLNIKLKDLFNDSKS